MNKFLLLASYLVFIIVWMSGVWDSKVFSLDTCQNLENRLSELKKRKSEAQVALEKNEGGLMKAKEILLLARARGDVKAAEVAEEAIRKFEENIKKNKSMITRCQEEITEVEKTLKLCFGDECDTVKKRIERTRTALSQQIEDARKMSDQYLELQKNIEELREQRNELLRMENVLEFVLGSLEPISHLPNTPNIKRIAEKLKTSITYAIAQFAKDNVDLTRALSTEGEKMARMLEEAKRSAEELKTELEENIELLQYGIGTALDLTDLLSKILKAKNVFEKALRVNNTVRVVEYSFKSTAIFITSSYLGQELLVNLYATDKQIEAIEALRKELEREMEIYKKCKELGKIKEEKKN
ncbi:MAG: hypothetical protein N2513_04040 [Deltaproteobacteria bacterium]|nr:hypothetical protein [Deltaproteobacteria bacterium]